MIVYLKDDCPIPPTSVIWRQHRRQNVEKWDKKYVGMMITFNELSRATSYEVVGDDDLHIAENLDPEETIAIDKKVRHGVKFEIDESLNLDHCSINRG